MHQPGPEKHTRMLLAGRFLRQSGTWIDLARGVPVVVVHHQAGARREQLAWADGCAMLARLRHPLINPLIDYGAAGPASLFEAYAAGPPLECTRNDATHLLTHAVRFLGAHGVTLSAGSAAHVLRAVRLRASADDEPVRPVGVVLQPRGIEALVAEFLAAGSGAAVRKLTISGPPGSGLSTACDEAAREARLQGYVPICTRALVTWAALAELVAHRHVCLLGRSDDPPGVADAAAAFAAALARRPRRAHAWLQWERTDRPRAGVLSLDQMRSSVMTSMIYVDPDYGPSEAAVLEALRRSAGTPKRLVEVLNGTLATGSGAATVHERPAPYELPNAPPGPAVLGVEAARPARESARTILPSRLSATLSRAAARALTLERRGRHVAAARALRRAAHVFGGRGAAERAAACWLQLGWMARSRGAIEAAHAHAEQAAHACHLGASQIDASLLRAICWTDEQRFEEAEPCLRGLLVAAAANACEQVRHRCALALARLLCTTAHLEDVPGLLNDPLGAPAGDLSSEAWVIKSRLLLASRDVAGGIHAAHEALERSDTCGPRVLLRAHRAVAEAYATLGDVATARRHAAAGLALARTARLPLAALRCHALLFRACRQDRPASPESQRLRSRLQRALHRDLPPRTAGYLRDCLAGEPLPRPATVTSSPPFEHLLEIAQAAADDGSAVASVVEAVRAQIDAAAIAVIAQDGRVLFSAGRAWRDRSPAAARALTSGQRVPFDALQQPPEAAEPIRCGGDHLGVIAAQWVPGSVTFPGRVADCLRAASLVVATHLRAQIEAAQPPPAPAAWGDLLGDSAVACALREAVHRAARAPFPVLVMGESGSGKELVARAIHRLSPRHTRRFCAINCAALGDDLVEAELFGHTRGAFTGAAAERAGLFEEADGGTLFLDEVGELSARAQAKLLRVLQEGEVRRVGENMPRRVDVRVVAATNRDLEHETTHGRFRLDLRFRLDVLRIVVPPLRERVSDVPLLAQHFWRAATSRVGSQATLGPEALAALARYDWPGNVRELQNAIAWMAVHAPRRGRAGASLLPAHLTTMPLATGASFEAAREEFERRYVRAALARSGGQRQLAAKALGVSRQGLAKMMRRLGIETEPPIVPVAGRSDPGRHQRNGGNVR